MEEEEESKVRMAHPEHYKLLTRPLMELQEVWQELQEAPRLSSYPRPP